MHHDSCYMLAILQVFLGMAEFPAHGVTRLNVSDPDHIKIDEKNT
mgnify:CR=1